MSALVGLLSCGISSLLFGSMFVPVRRCKPGDGIFMQFIMCSAIFTAGTLVFFFRGLPQFQPLAMLGGFGWAVGNLTAMPIIDAIGLGLGVLIWGSVNCCVGWAAGRFGFFGIRPSIPSNQTMNYLGLAFVVIGGVLFSQVKATTSVPRSPAPVRDDEDEEEDRQPASVAVAQTEAEQRLLTGEQQAVESAPSPTDQLEEGITGQSRRQARTVRPLPKKKIIGLLLSVIAGFCYGTTFIPAIYIQDNPEKFKNPSKDGIDYVFSQFTGIYLTSIAVLIVYLAYKRNKPQLDPQIIGPALLTGFMWATAQMFWFVANDGLSQAVTFPINSMVPGCVATLWSVFFFKEIRGKKNMRLLCVAIAITLTGAALVGLSK